MHVNKTGEVYISCTDTAESCGEGITCLAPSALSRPAVNENATITNVTIEVWWDAPPLDGCCTSEVFSYPLVEYAFRLAGSPNPLNTEVNHACVL